MTTSPILGYNNMEKRYLVYTNWNGQIHTSIEYEELTDGEGKIKNLNELKRFEIGIDIKDIKLLKEIYPLEEIKNEETAINS